MAKAKTSKSRAWFFPTSPRSPYKLQGELKLLKQLEGEVWNSQTQIEFTKLLMDYPEFYTDKPPKNPALSGRDRATRGPRLLGFVHFPKRGKKGGLLKFTTVGNLFLEATEEEQVLIFQRQLAKVQFKSPLHDSKGFEDMTVKPLMVMIKLLLALNSMNKEEIALFANTLIDAKDVSSRIEIIQKYRADLANLNTRDKKIFRKEFAKNWVNQIYAVDIVAGRTKLREGGKDFSKTKYRTLKDYADSTIRYLRATGLFTVTPHGQRLMLLNANLDDAKFLLDNYGIGLSEYTNLHFDDYIENYLGNPSLPLLRRDNPKLQEADLIKMVAELSKYDEGVATQITQNYISAKSNLEKLQILSKLESALSGIQISNEAKQIRDNLSVSLKEIKTIYSGITSKQSEILDRPLMYEWNTWRAMVLINDAKNVQANYTSDTDGNPVSTAGGNKPDIQVEYNTFHLAVEVTLSGGKKQYEMEGESVCRHLGEIQKKHIDNGDTRPVFGVFVAEALNDSVINYLLTQARFKSQVYKGAIRMVPMKRATFELFVESALGHPNFSHKVLHNFFESIFSHESIQLGEYDWVAMIESKIKSFDELQAIQAA